MKEGYQNSQHSFEQTNPNDRPRLSFRTPSRNPDLNKTNPILFLGSYVLTSLYRFTKQTQFRIPTNWNGFIGYFGQKLHDFNACGMVLWFGRLTIRNLEYRMNCLY
jgi:hypothetical protein